jgi:hypothetical protein
VRASHPSHLDYIGIKRVVLGAPLTRTNLKVNCTVHLKIVAKFS